jgi:hypothetical protein
LNKRRQVLVLGGVRTDDDGALVAWASLSISPIRMAIGALVSTMRGPFGMRQFGHLPSNALLVQGTADHMPRFPFNSP